MIGSPIASIPDPESELSQLTAAMFDGSITVPDRDRLVAILRDPTSRQSYRRMVWLHANLMRLWSDGVGGMVWAPQPVPVPAEPDQSSSASSEGLFALVNRIVGFGDRLRNHASRAAVVAVVGLLGTAVVCLALLAGTGFFRSSELPTPMRPPRIAGAIAQIAAVESPVWSADAKSWRLRDSLMPATKVALERGRVEIACDDGATIVLEGPAVFEVKTGTDVVLDRGKATVTLAGAAKVAARFTLQTPTATVTDLGTSFGVVVRESGETAVTVFDGLVELLPRLDGAVPLRLAAGEAGNVQKRQPARQAKPSADRFVRSLPKTSPDLLAALAKHGWNEARATPIYSDSFAGVGPLDGSKPSARGGVGDNAWIAPAEGWEINAAAAVIATSHGAAVLPFQPQPGHMYLVSAVLDASDGGIGWGAVGFANNALTTAYTPHGPWMLQRHDPAKQLNQCFAGPGETQSVGRGDRLKGRQARAILLDTTAPTWRAVFFADGRAVGESSLDPSATAITHVCLSTFPNTRVAFRSFLVSSFSRLDR
jgi:hypothetical protein